MSETRPLHRLFGLSWIDFFQGTPIVVETELDLSLKQQFIDLVLIRKGPGPLPRPLPDGFEDLAVHNLLTFKSHQEALAAWALWELVGHFVNYRKQASQSLDDLLPEADFRLFAVCARFPAQPGAAGRVDAAAGRRLRGARAGVADSRDRGACSCRCGNTTPCSICSAAREELLRYGREHYRPHSTETSTLLHDLFQVYSEEPDMPDKLKEYVRESLNRILASLPPEERLKGLTAEEVIRGLPPETLERWRDN